MRFPPLGIVYYITCHSIGHIKGPLSVGNPKRSWSSTVSGSRIIKTLPGPFGDPWSVAAYQLSRLGLHTSLRHGIGCLHIPLYLRGFVALQQGYAFSTKSQILHIDVQILPLVGLYPSNTAILYTHLHPQVRARLDSLIVMLRQWTRASNDEHSSG